MTSLPLTLLFENDAILAVNKPAGIPSHSLSDLNQITVESLLKKMRPEIIDLHLLHRLDTGTSGVLLFAKNIQIFERMREKFKLRQIQKFYRAWSYGNESTLKHESESNLNFLKRLPYHLELPLAHHPKSKKRMLVLEPDRKLAYRGKPIPAHTIIHSYKKTHQSDGKNLFEFEIQIITGVTHQIRVHLAHLGFPLVGDSTYGNDPVVTPVKFGLHAQKIEFELAGLNYLIEAPCDRF